MCCGDGSTRGATRMLATALGYFCHDMFMMRNELHNDLVILHSQNSTQRLPPMRCSHCTAHTAVSRQFRAVPQCLRFRTQCLKLSLSLPALSQRVHEGADLRPRMSVGEKQQCEQSIRHVGICDPTQSTADWCAGSWCYFIICLEYRS